MEPVCGVGCGRCSVSKLLIDEPPLLVFPSLAALVGTDESLILQQVHFLSLIVRPDEHGVRWVRKTYGEWHQIFHWYSLDTVKRAFRVLEKGQFLLSRMEKRYAADRTKSYRVNYDKLDAVPPRRVNLHDHEGNLPPPSGQNASMSSGQNASSDITRVKSNNKNNIYIPSREGEIYTFDEFFGDLPRKRNRAKAKQAWDELNPDLELQGKIRTAVKRAKNSTDWETKKFIPSPETLIRDRFWENDYIARGTNAVLKATPDPVPTPAEPEKEKREYSDEEKAQNSHRLREALKGVDLNANRTEPA